jgi:2'-5' RNA ligase
MRLFIAVDVPREVGVLAEWIRQALSASHGDVATRGLRWVDPAVMHLTLRFLGAVGEPVGSQAVAACGGTLARHAFPIGFGGLAWLPDASRPRVLVLPVTRGAEGLLRLKREVDERLPPGVPAEGARPFRPHLTLARVRDDWGAAVRRAANDLLEVGAALEPSCLVDHVTLYESDLRPSGPVYHERARLTLPGASA